ncbi:leucine-rich PPR motif-containing protein, mitochondrial [Drosophila yakuba]|uniref:leucine-rich PPR motif-containing protein, mitochondrial n=1 Tax=Drosophila yakuba TaxID=7245 RepID=UPI0019308990|nr:leucine-rich PPR motif-containing protein, mitochondrial [Drosophila yakuba]XP_039227650.1 leucine-rich PPR motif-containing protein, mitochondrial [Drosophila yakuba]
MQRARLLQSVWLCRQRLGQLPGRSASFASLPFSYATKPATPLLPLQPLQLRSLGTGGVLSAAERRSRRPASAEKPKASVADVWSQLETYYRQHDLINFDHCQRLLELLQQSAPPPGFGIEEVHFLLGSCVPELLPAQSSQARLQLFQSLWAQLIKLGQPTLAHYHTKLQVLRQNRLPLHDYRSLLAEIAVYHGAADSSLYGALLDVAGAAGNMRMATEILSEMRERSFALTEHNFHALLLGHARSGDLPGAESVLASMRAAGIQLGSSTQALWFEALVENGQVAQAKELLQVEQGFTAPQLLQMLRGLLASKDVDTELIQLLVKELPREFLTGLDLPPAIRSLCIQLVHQGRTEVVIQLVGALPAPKFELQNQNQNVDEYGALLLQEFFRAHVPLDQTLQFAGQLVQRNQNVRALHLVAELALRRLPSSALHCLEVLSAAGEQLRPHYFWPLILHHYRREGESGMLRLLAEMQRLRVECDEETLRHYLLPHLRQTLTQPLEAVKALEAAGVKPSHTLCPVVSHLLQQHQMTEVLDLLERYPTRLDLSTLLQPLASLAVNARATKRFEVFAKVIQALQQKALQRADDFVGSLLLQMSGPQTRLRQDPAALRRFLHELRRLELQISPAASEALLSVVRHATDDADLVQEVAKTLQKMKNPQLALPADTASLHGGFIKHPRDMSIDELECHLVELESKQLNPRGVLRRLLQLSVRSGRLERAQQLLAKCQALKVQTSAGMMASILDLHIKLRDLPRAQESLERLSSTYPAFQIDEHKVIDYAALLVQGQQLEAAKHLLQRRAEQHKVVGGDYVMKNVWQLLTNVGQLAAAAPRGDGESSKPLNQTREWLDFLRGLGYCQSHNALLGPVVREWLLKGDLDAAVAEFQRLANTHKHTPLQFELLSLLVRLGNGDEQEMARFPGVSAESAQQHLAAVTATVSRVHGAANMNSALLLALAESGKETQLRRLIINPEFRINHELLVKNCEHLGQEGAVRTLLRLARGVRGVQRTIDEQKIYDLLLAQFCRSNDYEAALDLFERLEGDDELKVSHEFLRNLVQLLQVNQVEVPSAVALRAHVR